MSRGIARLLRWFYGHLYTDLAWAYDAVAWLASFGRWRRWQAAALADLPPGRVLEVGHGPGHLLADLARGRGTPVGIDCSPHMSRIAARRLRRQRLPLRLVRARVEHLPFRGRSFASVVSTFPSEYIYELDVHREVARVMEVSGVFVVIPAASIVGGSIGDRFVGWLLRLVGDSTYAAATLDRILQASPFTFVIERLHMAHSVVLRVTCRIRPSLAAEPRDGYNRPR